MLNPFDINRKKILRTIKRTGVTTKITKEEVVYRKLGWTHTITRGGKDLWCMEVDSPVKNHNWTVADTQSMCEIIQRCDMTLDWLERYNLLERCDCPYWNGESCFLEEELCEFLEKLKKGN